jgi:hypothetical protein
MIALTIGFSVLVILVTALIVLPILRAPGAEAYRMDPVCSPSRDSIMTGPEVEYWPEPTRIWEKRQREERVSYVSRGLRWRGLEERIVEKHVNGSNTNLSFRLLRRPSPSAPPDREEVDSTGREDGR